MVCDSYINDYSCLASNFLMVKRPDIELPEDRYEEYSIPGRDGKQYVKRKLINDYRKLSPKAKKELQDRFDTIMNILFVE